MSKNESNNLNIIPLPRTKLYIKTEGATAKKEEKAPNSNILERLDIVPCPFFFHVVKMNSLFYFLFCFFPLCLFTQLFFPHSDVYVFSQIFFAIRGKTIDTYMKLKKQTF